MKIEHKSVKRVLICALMALVCLSFSFVAIDAPAYAATKTYTISTSSKPCDSSFLRYSTYNKYTKQYYLLRSYMLSRAEYKDYRFVWAFTEPEKYEFLTKNRNTRIVKFNSDEERSAMMRAKYWIVNYRLLDHLIPKEDQIYVQCWHGTPLKRLGYDLINSDNAMAAPIKAVAPQSCSVYDIYDAMSSNLL